MSGLTAGTVTTDLGTRPCWSGGVVSPAVEAAQPWDTAIPSWNARTPPGTWLQVDLRAHLEDGRWTRWYTMAVWASGSETIRRHSVEGQDDGDARIQTDTLRLRPETTARAFQHRLRLFTTDPGVTPIVHSVSVVTSSSRREPAGPGLRSDGTVWGTDLPVPQLSQRVEGDAVGGWCSPTATAMVLAWWGRPVSVPAAGRGPRHSASRPS